MFRNLRDFLLSPTLDLFNWSRQNNDLIVLTVTLKFKLANN